jgi:outer membrane protein assembly factor BamB
VAASDARLPVAFGPEQNVLWRAATPAGDSSPCVAAGRVFLTGFAGEGEDATLLVLCFDRASGAELWRKTLAVPQFEQTYSHGPATPTPACDGERVFAAFGSFGLVAYDLEGQELWRKPLPLAKNTFGTASSPLLAGGRLIFVRDEDQGSFLEAFDPASGASLWRVDRTGFGSGWSTPGVWRRGDALELLVYGVGFLTAYDLASGKVRWSVPGLSDEPIVTPAFGAGLVFATSYNMKTNPEVIGLPQFAALVAELDRDGNGTLDRAEVEPNKSVLSRFDADGEGDHPLRMFFRMMDADRSGQVTAKEYERLIAWVDGFSHRNGLLAIRPGDGETPAEVVWTHERGVPECPSPLFQGARVYMVANGGLVTCVDAQSGAVRFEGRLDAGGPYYASPVAGDGKLYSASARGVVSVLELGDELVVLARNDLGERITATPGLSEGVVFVRTAGGVYAFGEEPGGAAPVGTGPK